MLIHAARTNECLSLAHCARLHSGASTPDMTGPTFVGDTNVQRHSTRRILRQYYTKQHATPFKSECQLECSVFVHGKSNSSQKQ
eukprot:SAG31_NODE_251_length_19069_cov_5.843226_10_plen_84_part_00